VTPCLDGAAVASLQALAARQQVDPQVIDYAVRMVRATRDYPGLVVGSGSRGALALIRGARVAALFDGRRYVTPDDVKTVALPALRHRVALAPDALLEGRSTNDLLIEIVATIPAPRV
jgi:MoxR-like ATPase